MHLDQLHPSAMPALPVKVTSTSAGRWSLMLELSARKASMFGTGKDPGCIDLSGHFLESSGIPDHIFKVKQANPKL